VTIMEQSLRELRDVLDRYRGRYAKLNGARDLGDYLDRTRPREDEELLTEPILADLLESVLGFPRDSYFPQLGRGGLKPDFTPHDLVAHRFVLDAKSSTQELDRHEGQIRAYIDQRQLDYGVLFNLRELRVYRRGERGQSRGRPRRPRRAARGAGAARRGEVRSLAGEAASILSSCSSTRSSGWATPGFASARGTRRSTSIPTGRPQGPRPT